MRYLIDTNIVIAFLIDEPAMLRELARAPQTFVSAITLGEIYYGIFKSARPSQNMGRISKINGRFSVIGAGAGTAEVYGRVSNELRAVGGSIPVNDVWIAAIALEYSMTLVTRDAHFQRVQGLSTVAW